MLSSLSLTLSNDEQLSQFWEPNYFSLDAGGFPLTIMPSGTNKTLFITTWHREEAYPFRIHRLDISAAATDTSEQNQHAERIFETLEQPVIIGPAPSSDALLIGVGSSFSRVIREPDVRGLQLDPQTAHEKLNYFLIRADETVATPLPEGLASLRWSRDESGFIGRKDDNIVYIPKDAPEQMYTLAASGSWLASWAP